MRVLTYNIHGWRDRAGQVDVPRLARVIASSQADIVALNEVFHPLAAPGSDQPALLWLADLLGMQAAFGVALMPQFAFAPLASYGNALLTRYPLLAHAGHHLTPVAGHEQRGLLEARVLLPDGKTPFSVYVIHLDQSSEAVRVQQLTAAFQWTVRDRNRPHLLLGDFNALAPDDYAGREQELAALAEEAEFVRLVREPLQVVALMRRRGYVDRTPHDAAAPAPTFPAAQPTVRIDYIWASAPLATAVRWRRPWEAPEAAQASDHLPLLAEIELPV